MAKAMLIMDMPCDCTECQLCYAEEIIMCEAGGRPILDDIKKGTRPTWCPLREVDIDTVGEKEIIRKPLQRIVNELVNLKKCYLGEEDAVMKPMSFADYIQEIIEKAGGIE